MHTSAKSPQLELDATKVADRPWLKLKVDVMKNTIEPNLLSDEIEVAGKPWSQLKEQVMMYNQFDKKFEYRKEFRDSEEYANMDIETQKLVSRLFDTQQAHGDMSALPMQAYNFKNSRLYKALSPDQ